MNIIFSNVSTYTTMNTFDVDKFSVYEIQKLSILLMQVHAYINMYIYIYIYIYIHKLIIIYVLMRTSLSTSKIHIKIRYFF